MRKRIICLLLPLMLLALAACGPAQQTQAPEYSSKEEFSTEERITTDSAEQESTPEETSAPDETTMVNIEGTAPVGGSAAQVVSFYNQYANAVKTAEKITIKKHDKRDMTMDIPAVMRALMPDGEEEMDPSKDETITETFVNGKGAKNTALKLNDFLPVSGKPYVSQLKASHVQSAACTKQGEEWVVTIKLKDEPLNMDSSQMNADMSEAEQEKMTSERMAQSGYGSSMEISFGGDDRPTADSGGEQRQFPGSGSVKMEGAFTNGTIIASFNQEGQLTSLTHFYNSSMNTSMLGMKMSMNGASKQEYHFTW